MRQQLQVVFISRAAAGVKQQQWIWVQQGGDWICYEGVGEELGTGRLSDQGGVDWEAG